MTDIGRNKIVGYLSFFIGLILVVLITLFRQISSDAPLVIYYIIPISLVTWFSGPIAGILITIISILGWLGEGMRHFRSFFTNAAFLYINIAFRILLLCGVVYIMNRLKLTLAREKELNQRKSDFVANVSHELKSPLSIIKEDLNMILEEGGKDISNEQKALLEMGLRNINRLVRLIMDLLDVSKIESGKMQLKIEEADIELLLNDTLKTYEKEINKKQLILKKDIQRNIGLLRVDKDKLIEVIVNLLTNAIKYTSNGTITVKLVGTDREIRFEITDTGAGIAKENIGKIFDKFERILTEKHEGTGLGLPIAKDIIELHKGKIWVESQVSHGSKFVFTLPRDPKKRR